MRSNRTEGAAAAAVVETLEGRRLLTATVTGGVLEIDGTRKSDVIAVSLNDAGRIQVDLNGQTLGAFTQRAVTSIRIVAGWGEDIISVGSRRRAVHEDVYVDAGLNNDTVQTSAGDDEIHGGAGLDSLRGGAGDDAVYGEANSDTLFGEDGDDNLQGGDENDEIHTGLGAGDVAWGQRGLDTFYWQEDRQKIGDPYVNEPVIEEV